MYTESFEELYKKKVSSLWLETLTTDQSSSYNPLNSTEFQYIVFLTIKSLSAFMKQADVSAKAL